MLDTSFRNPVREVEDYTDLDNVTVNEAEVEDLAETLANSQLEIPAWDAPVFPDEDASSETVVDFLMVGNAINFAFNDPSTGQKFETEYLDFGGWKGSFGMWAMLKREMDRGVPILDPSVLSQMTVDQFSDLIRPRGQADLPHVEKRVQNLNDLGAFMEDNGLESFQALFESHDSLHGEEGLITTLTECAAYQDERTYRGDSIVFNKRAQLAVTMVYDRMYIHNDHEWANFDDMDSLTIFADYGIPAYLNTVGAIEYSSSLTEAVRNNTEIPENSTEEVEIRIATVQVGSMLRDILESEHNQTVGVPELDYALWELRQEANTNAHQTITDSY